MSFFVYGMQVDAFGPLKFCKLSWKNGWLGIVHQNIIRHSVINAYNVTKYMNILQLIRTNTKR
jgi:hypothetical protein